MKIKVFNVFLCLGLLACSSGIEKTKADNEIEKDSCCVKPKTDSSLQNSLQSQITCPKCGYKKMEMMPTDVCKIKYTCEKCDTILFPKDGDCCVFCTYGTHKCPSKQ